QRPAQGGGEPRHRQPVSIQRRYLPQHSHLRAARRAVHRRAERQRCRAAPGRRCGVAHLLRHRAGKPHRRGAVQPRPGRRDQAMKTLITQLWLLACLLLAVAVEAEPLEPRHLVEITVDEVMADMKASAETYTRDPAALQAMVIERVGPHFNFPRMAQLAMA